MFCCCGVHCESRFSENDLSFNFPFKMKQLSELLFLHQYLIFSIGLNSALFSIVQHYSSLFRIIHHCSALFSIVQHCSRELKTSCRQPVPQCLKSILDRRRQRVFNSRSCRWVPSTLLSTSTTSTIYHFRIFFWRKQLFCAATECHHTLNSTILAGESETIKHSFSKLILHN